MGNPVRAARADRGRRAYLSGAAAEDIAAAHYVRQGMTLLHQRWRGSVGEIDIIIRAPDGLIFVEVKKGRDFATAAQMLTPAQNRRICQTAAEYLGHEALGQDTATRFDLALINSRGEIDVIENAFGI